MISSLLSGASRLTSAVQDEQGQALAEYGLLLALVVVVAVATVAALGIAISSILNSVGLAMP